MKCMCGKCEGFEMTKEERINTVVKDIASVNKDIELVKQYKEKVLELQKSIEVTTHITKNLKDIFGATSDVIEELLVECDEKQKLNNRILELENMDENDENIPKVKSEVMVKMLMFALGQL